MSEKNCPYCSETIAAEAVKCRYCGEWLTEERSGSDTIINLFASKYRIQEELGRGGMAVVYRATKHDDNKEVALKVIPKEHTTDKEFVTRFEREAVNCSKINHQSIIKVYDYGNIAGYPYIAMELLEGKNLFQLIRNRTTPFTNAEIRGILKPLLEALHHAHDKGLIHRDIKSSNIMFASDGRPVLMDFGIAKSKTASPLTVAGTFMGTPEYSSPEQAEAQPHVDHRTDIYSIGVVAYEMATLRLPFQNDNPLIVLNNIVRKHPQEVRSLNPNISIPMAAAIARAMDKDKRKRFASCDEFKQNLETMERVTNLGSLPPQSLAGLKSQYPTVQRKSKISVASMPRNQQMLLLALAIVLVVIITSGLIYILLQNG